MTRPRYVWVHLAGPQRPPTCARVLLVGAEALVVDLFGTRRRVPLARVKQYRAGCVRLARLHPDLPREGEP